MLHKKSFTPIRKGATAAYSQIARELRHRIADGEFNEARRLPTEDVLMAEYDVGRHTVRAALELLVSDGLIERFAGRGTFLSERKVEEGDWRIRSLDDIINESFLADPELLETVFMQARSDAEAGRALNLDPNEQMLRITAVRRGSDGPLACSQIFVPADIGQRILPELHENLHRKPIIRLIETRLGIRTFQALQVATMRVPPALAAKALGEPTGRMTITLLRTYTAKDGTAFEFSRLFGKAGSFSNTIEFTRLEQPNIGT